MFYYLIMNILKRGFFRTFEAIKQHKLLFSLLFLVQLVFVVGVIYFGIVYQIKLAQNVQNIMGPLQQANFNSTSIQQGQSLLPDMTSDVNSIVLGYQEMVNNLIQLGLILMGGFLFLNGFIWSVANYMVKKGPFLKYWGKFILSSLFFLIPTGLISYITLKSLIGTVSWFQTGLNVLEISCFILFYFMLISFSLSEVPLKKILPKTFRLGLGDAVWILLSLMFSLILILLSLLLVYVGMGIFSLMIISLLLLILSLALGKIYLISVISELNTEVF